MDLGTRLAEIVPAARVRTGYLDRTAFANDASVYRLVPRAVVHAETVDEVRGLLAFAARERLPLTFRAAGTSLSGQAVTDGLLVVLSRGWHDWEVLDEGRRIRLQPGVVGGLANQRLRPWSRKIGPDPASINACMIGGILANNSSGMCCGTEQNAYHTLDTMRFLLPDGTPVDTAHPDADARLAADAPHVVAGLQALRRRIRGDRELAALIERKYRMKNTMGYSLNAFLDYETPAELLAHLMIGSEGTLGFIAEAVLRTVPDAPFKYTGLLFFENVPAACRAIEPLRDGGARALELIDRPSLRAVEGQPGVPARVRSLPAEAAALLVEYESADEAQRDVTRREVDRMLPRLPLLDPPEWTVDPARQAALWTVRKGLIPSVGACRARGTSFIIEDVVFPVPRLADGVGELQALLRSWRYDDAIVFGHAKDGNLHFVLTQAFHRDEDVRRYDGFMHELAALVATRYGGALKAEHGTGRNMAPFVETEWGRSAVAVMRELKSLLDPDGFLNPGVVLNDDPRAHVTHLKDLPEVEDEVDRCIECGFCERWCPSRDLTLTPRQRIVVRREMARLRRRAPDSGALRELEARWSYAAEETCATDGLCALACPVSIDTGKLTKRLRARAAGEAERRFAEWTVERASWIETLARGALRAGHLLEPVVGARRLARLTPRGWPGWRTPMPRAARVPRGASIPPATADAIFFPSCVSRVFAEDGDGTPTGTVAAAVAARAGVRLATLPEASGICCGMPYASKGFRAAHRLALARTVDALWECSRGGTLPIVTEASPCAWTLRGGSADLPRAARERLRALEVLDGIEYAHERLLPRLRPRRLDATVAVHPVCSARKLGLDGMLANLGAACAERCVVAVDGACCGAAGDRGFAYPELADAAAAPLARDLDRLAPCAVYASNRTCEVTLSRTLGRPVVSFWRLLDAATAPAGR